MTREYYNSLNIRLLQMMGKEIGVKAPTRLSKADLIEQIILVESGVVEPTTQANQGRPPFKCNLKLNNLNDLENEPPEATVEANDEKEAVAQYTKKEPRVEQNHNINYEQSNYQQQYNSPRYNARKHEFVTKRIRTIERLLEEIFDYVIYEGL